MRRHRNDGLRKRCGCLRRNWSECSHAWYFNFTWKGANYRLNLDRHLGQTLKGKTDAKEAADGLRKAIREGRFLPPVEDGAAARPAITFEQFGRVYIERRLRKREGRSRHGDSLLHQRICDFELVAGDQRSRFGDKALVAVTVDDVEVFLQSVRSTGRAASTYNHYRQFMRRSAGPHAKATCQSTPC